MSTETANAARLRRQFPKLTPLEGELLTACESFVNGVAANDDIDLKQRLSYHTTRMSKAIAHAHGEYE